MLSVITTQVSLDVYLHSWPAEENGPDSLREEVYSDNVTHNLRLMWKKAGIYEMLRDHRGRAAEMILPLTCAVADIAMHEDQYRKLEPANKWGTVEHAIRFLKDLVRACDENPTAFYMACP